MSCARSCRFRLFGPVVCLLLLLLFSSCKQFGLTDDQSCADCDGCADKARVCKKPTVRALAQDLDALEAHIERFGSVVAKQPDVWGQARLTKHRQEFEQIMAAELTKFDVTLQGSVSGSDQAYLADAFALSAAASAKAAGRSRATSTSTSSSTAAAAPSESKSSSPASSSPQPLPLPDQSDTFAAFSNISRTSATLPKALEFAQGKTGIALEPTVILDQRARYLNHLHELRRINEGDDTADSPGYSLNLVRIPISVLPGKCTEVGHGAEVTLTIQPFL